MDKHQNAAPSDKAGPGSAPSSSDTTFATLTEGDLPVRSLTSAIGVEASVLENGCLHYLNAPGVMVNLFPADPLAGGGHRLYVRQVDEESVLGWVEVIGPRSSAKVASDGQRIGWQLTWDSPTGPVQIKATLGLHDQVTAWGWTVELHSEQQASFDAILVQDVGIANRGQIRNNEAYTSQYIDHRIDVYPGIGHATAARQNLPQGDNNHPWLMHAVAEGAAGAMTDGYAFFGTAYRDTGEPAAILQRRWTSRVLQYEWSCHALLSNAFAAGADQPGRCTFVARFVDDHPAPSSVDDIEHLAGLIESPATTWPSMDFETAEAFNRRPASPRLGPIFPAAELSPQQVDDRFGEDHRHVDTIGEARASFFHEDNAHVVMQRKEFEVRRRHAHILKAGRSTLPGPDVLCGTSTMAGGFASHVCLGNTNFCKALPVSRDALGVGSASGLTLEVTRDEDDAIWQRLGIASAFEMRPDRCRWVYAASDATVTVEASADENDALQFQVEIESDQPMRVRLIADVIAGDQEYVHPTHLTLDRAAGRLRWWPDQAAMMKGPYPEASFSLDFADASQLDELGGDELLYEDGHRRGYAVVVAITQPVHQIGWSIHGTLGVEDDKSTSSESLPVPKLLHPDDDAVASLGDALPWFAHNAGIHLTAPHGIEQYSGAAWGVRDVCQGPFEWLLSVGDHHHAAEILADVFSHQYEQRGDWPQWYMHPPFQQIQSSHCHGDIVVWPLLATSRYLETTGDLSILDREVPYTRDDGFAFTDAGASIQSHIEKALQRIESQFIEGTSLLRYGDGDWNDSLQPAQDAMRHQMVSTWTQMLLYQATDQLAEAMETQSDEAFANRLRDLAERVHCEIQQRLIADGETAGLYLHHEEDHQARYLLHPRDEQTGIRHRLLPMIRGIISESLTAEQAEHHAELITTHLLAPDGARLFDRPPHYRGGLMRHFQRAESAAFFGREVGLMYTHAHLRYAQAMAKLGRVDDLLKALLTINPVALAETVSNALPRQANAYFSSSDAAFADRRESEAEYEALMQGDVPVHGGWRVYSSGPGIFIGLIREQFLGLRRRYKHLVFDPVLPASCNGLKAELPLLGRTVTVQFHVDSESASARRVTVNGHLVESTGRETNPYREGGLLIPVNDVAELLNKNGNQIEIWL
jgi:CRISPR-associated protein Csx3